MWSAGPVYPALPSIRSPSACLWWMWAGSGVHTPCLTHHLHQDYSSQSGFNALDCRRIKLSRSFWIVYLNSFSNVTSWCLKDHPNVSVFEVILSILTKNHLNWLCIWELNAEWDVSLIKGGSACNDDGKFHQPRAESHFWSGLWCSPPSRPAV